MDNNAITFDITKHLGVIRQHNTGWKRELNLVSWNGNFPKFDIRDWDDEHMRMSRGITLSEEEAKALHELLGEAFDDDYFDLDGVI